ncbi:MAG: malectin domain-containing carbohydrate-binding protein [Capsulimonadaceae bacterium]
MTANSRRRRGFPPPGFTAAATFVLAAITLAAIPAFGQSYTQTWGDSFTGAAGTLPSASNWVMLTGNNWGTGEVDYGGNTTASAEINGNDQLITTVWYDSANSDYYAAHLSTQGLESTTYGNIESKIEASSTDGLMSAFWMLPTSFLSGYVWPNCGEIDILETLGDTPDNAYGTIHGFSWNNNADNFENDGLGAYYTNSSSLASAYNVYGIYWQPYQIQWYINSTTYSTINIQDMSIAMDWAYDQPFYIIRNEELESTWAGPIVSGNTVIPNTAGTDYVHVNTWSGGVPGAPSNITGTAYTNAVALSWTASSTSGATYNVYCSTSPFAQPAAPPYTMLNYNTLVDSNLTTTSATITALTPNTTYWFYVSASNQGGESVPVGAEISTTGAGSSQPVYLRVGGYSVGKYMRDGPYLSGSGSTNFPNNHPWITVNTTGVTNAAPAILYQTLRWGPMTYTVTNLTPGTVYDVRFHFMEDSFTAAGDREFNGYLNGVQVMSNFDIYATSGSEYKACVEDFIAQSDEDGTIVVDLTLGAENDPSLCGLEVFTTSATVPNSATSLTATTVSSSQINLSWTASTTSGVTYNIYRGNDPYFASSYANRIASGVSGTTYNDTTVPFPGMIYYYRVTAVTSANVQSVRSNTASATASQAASDLIIAIDAGSTSAEGTYVADTDWGGQTWTTSTAATITTTGVTNPAPESVYQSERYGNMIYMVNGLKPGATYQVRLDNSENYWTAAGDREFNVAINGTQVMTNFDVYATAGGEDIAIVNKFNTEADANGHVTITFTKGAADWPTIKGITLTYVSDVVLSAPASVTASASGSAVNVAWSSISGATSYTLLRSCNTSGVGLHSVTGISTNSYSDTSSLSPGYTYNYVVEAVSASGTSGVSTPATIRYIGSGSETFTDPLNDTSLMQGYSYGAGASTGIQFNTSNTSGYFGTDTSMLERDLNKVEQVVYSLPNMSSFTATIYTYNNVANSVVFFASTNNGLTWQSIATTQGTETMTQTGGPPAWGYYNVTNTSALPTGTTDLAMQFNTNSSDDDWDPEIGQISINYTASAAPSAPTSLGATGGNSQVSLSWGAGSGATSYNIYRGTTSGGESSTAIATGITVTNFTNTGLTNGTAYYYKVAGVNANGTSPQSNEATATPQSSGSMVLGINCGGTATGSWVADEYYSGGTANSVSSTINTANVTNPAPVAVYQSNRFGTCTYTVAGLSASTNYTVRLHFCETYWTAAGDREFNVTLGSTQVLTNFDIYATAGGENIANIQQFPAASNSSGQIVIVFTTVVDNAQINGIEIDTVSSSAPPAPTGLSATGGSAQVALSWSASSGATSYNVYRGTASGAEGATAIATGVTTTSYTNTGLAAGTTYYFTVAAVNSSGASGQSNEASAITISAAPTGLTATAGNAQVSLSWTGSAGAASYNVYRGTASGGESATAIATNVTTTTFVNTGLTNGTAYYFKVTAVNAGGTSAQSGEANATPLAAVPAAPTGLTATPGNAQVSLSWTASSSATSYNVYRGTASGGESSTAIATGITTTTTVNTSLTNGVTYYYKVAALNASGTSAQSNEASASPAAGGNFVMGINCGGTGTGSWVADEDYSGGTANSVSATINTANVINPAPMIVYEENRFGTCTYTIGGLTASASYTVRLHFCETYWTAAGDREFDVTINGTQVLTNFDMFATAGGEDIANVQQFTETTNSSGQFVIVFTSVVDNAQINGIEIDTAGGAPAAPTGLTATGGCAQVGLSWTGSSGATSYNVYRGTAAGGESTTAIATGIASTSYTNTGLPNATTYYYKIAAVSAAGTSGLSNEASAPTQTPVIQISCGNSSAAGSYVADTDYSGGLTVGVATTITTTGLVNPAPQAVYQNNRYNAPLSYTIGGLTANGVYTVRLHFCETYFTAAGDREFDVSIGSTQVLTNFDIYATAGGENIGTIQPFTATANSSGQIVISAAIGAANEPQINGIEVLH